MDPMTAQAQEPTCPPHDPQNTGPRRVTTAVTDALTTLALVILAGVIAFLARKDYPTYALLAMCLVPLLTGPSSNRHGGGK